MGFAIRRALACAIVVGGLGVRPARADAPVLRLADVVGVAVRQSPDLAKARFDIDAARGALLTASASEDTHVIASLDGQAVRTRDNDPSGEYQSRTVTGDVAVQRRLATGGTVSLAAGVTRQHIVGVSRDAMGNPVQSDIEQRYEASVIFAFVQPLLRGAGATAFQAPIRQAARQRDAAAQLAEAKARDVVVSLAQAYWSVAYAWRQLEVRKAALELAQQQLAYTEGAIRSEKVARSEALAVEQAIAVRKQDVLAGEQELYERSVALRQLAGLEIGPDAIAVRTEPLPDKVDLAAPDMAVVVREAFARSAELAALEAQRRAAEIGAAAADNAARSKLDLTISGGPLGAARVIGDAVSAVGSEPGYSVSAALSFDHAIERSAERGGQATARAALMQAKVAERDGRAKLALRATRAVQRAQAALASVALGDESIKLAEQNITAEQKRFELGKSTNFEVLRRQDELQTARLRQASAIADYLSARADLDGLSGAILARFGVVMP